jgi:hypothetical protein
MKPSWHSRPFAMAVPCVVSGSGKVLASQNLTNNAHAWLPIGRAVRAAFPCADRRAARDQDDLVRRRPLHHLAARQRRSCCLLPGHRQMTEPWRKAVPAWLRLSRISVAVPSTSAHIRSRVSSLLLVARAWAGCHGAPRMSGCTTPAISIDAAAEVDIGNRGPERRAVTLHGPAGAGLRKPSGSLPAATDRPTSASRPQPPNVPLSHGTTWDPAMNQAVLHGQ